MQVVATERLPIKMWLQNVEDGALKQARNLANLPFAYKHIAIMPDCHEGYGMPIGGVLATRGCVIPNAVGVDIGCGMLARVADIQVQELEKEDLKRVMGRIRELIPVGFAHNDFASTIPALPENAQEDWTITRQFQAATKQIGTLGGGNHFIEIQYDEDAQIWVMIHSGSRNLGKQVADVYNKWAEHLNRRYYSEVPKEHQLAFLPIEDDSAKRYMSEMKYCVDFAFANRQKMMDIIHDIFKEELGIEMGEQIGIAHNYAAWENHFGDDVIIHRKGATRVRKGEIGIIPGSQGTCSYIVEGLGNPESFMSCSHGAGRKMGRKEAKRSLVLEDEIKRLDDMGIIHSVRNKDDLDEAPGSYKDIDEVMKEQEDLVTIKRCLTPLAVIKG